MKLIQTQTLASASPTISFTSIPQTFTDLYVVLSGRTARGSILDEPLLRVNGLTTNIYSTRKLGGNGSSAFTNADPSTNVLYGLLATGSSADANTFGNSALYIPNYTGSTNKSVSIDSVMERNGTESYLYLAAGLIGTTAAITSISITGLTGADFSIGTTASLYGIGGAGDGYAAPKATGGVISYSGNYIIHTFFASGTFTPTQDLSNVEYLVIAGGGGGGSNTYDSSGGSGGGAGGYRSSVSGESSGGGGSPESKLSLTSGFAYTVTVGAGGGPQTAGSDSVFGAVTSVGGGRGGNPGIPTLGGSGGSGGGAIRGQSGAPAGTTNQGYAGGTSTTGYPYGAGGGGGAGAVGGNFVDGGAGGSGGNGVSSSITGVATTRAGGGGAGVYSLPAGTVPGSGGSGGGGSSTATNGQSATVNTGSGGGGASYNPNAFTGGNGGSGIVIVRYAA